MLQMIEMYPEQIARHWDSLRPTVEAALPPITRVTMDRMSCILQALMSGQLVMHLFTTDDKIIRGTIITAIINTVDMCERNLLVYSIFGIGGASREEVIDAYKLVMHYAKGNKCTSVTGFTSVPMIVAYVKSVGGQADQTFIRLEVV